MSFKKAERKSAKIKLAVTGPTGSGKTYSALRVAKGLGGKTAVIDTENGSASLYSDLFDFDVLDIKPPFTTEKYIAAINEAEKAGYDTILIDSLTHAWAGEGGLLEQKADLDSRPGTNHWTNWGPIDKKDQALKNAFLHSTCHVIATMRSKMEYAQNDSDGKKKIQKMGLAPIQRDGLTYDFTIVFDIAMDNKCEVSKDRTGLFAGKIFKIDESTGETILTWMNSGKAPDPIPEKPVAPVTTVIKVKPESPGISPAQALAMSRRPSPIVPASNPNLIAPGEIKQVMSAFKTSGWEIEDMKTILSTAFEAENLSTLKKEFVPSLLNALTMPISEALNFYREPEDQSWQELAPSFDATEQIPF